jgi:hypothetical protein
MRDFGNENQPKRQITAFGAFHRTPCKEELENAVWVQFELRKLEYLIRWFKNMIKTSSYNNPPTAQEKKIQQRNENEERLAERKPAGTHEPHWCTESEMHENALRIRRPATLAGAAVEHDALSEGKSNLNSVEQNKTTDKPHMRNHEEKSNEVDFLH